MIYLDIETIALPREERKFCMPKYDDCKFGNTKDEEKKQAKYDEVLQKWDDDAALNAHCSQVALIGLMTDIINNHSEILWKYQCFSLDANDERHNIQGLYDLSVDENHTIVGHNIMWDLRFLVRRSWILGIKPPNWIIAELNQYRPVKIFDTMIRWQLGNRQDNINLENVCGAFDIEVKNVKTKDGIIIKGSNFGKCWEKDKEACIEYNKQDVVAVKKLYEKLL